MVKIDLDGILATADAVRARAYAPYSRFAVGAAALGSDGRVYAGTNVENASYSLSLCAERAAIAAAVAGGASEILAVAVIANRSAPPCGACLQVIAELGPTATVVWGDSTRNYKVAHIGELLTKPFRLKPREAR